MSKSADIEKKVMTVENPCPAPRPKLKPSKRINCIPEKPPKKRKMFRGLFAFLVGVYTGIYACQNYEIPCVDDPKALYEKAKEFADKYRKQ